MSETSWPFHDGGAGTPVYEDQWSYMARQWSATGVVGAPGDANLQVYGNSSGREVHVRAGRACVRGHWFRLDAEETLAVSANSSGSPRIDRVVARLDPSADSIVLAVLPGTPAGSPAAPTLTQTDTGVWELTLAQVAVANGAATITAGNVTDERTFATVPYTPALSSQRPASPVVGQRIFETDTGLDKVWNGSAWVTPDQSLLDAKLNDANIAVGGGGVGGTGTTFTLPAVPAGKTAWAPFAQVLSGSSGRYATCTLPAPGATSFTAYVFNGSNELTVGNILWMAVAY